jgi:hypothetical protein
MDAEGKGRKRKGETRPESIDRKFVDLYPSLVWTRRLGAEIEIENTRKNRQAGVDAGVRLRASHRCYSMQRSDLMHVRGGKGLRGVVVVQSQE